MCEPVSAAAMVMTMVSAVAQAKAQADAGNFQAGMARNNAILSERAATDASVRGAYAAGVNNMKATQVIGQGIAEAGASGIDVTTGAPVETSATTRMMSTLDSEMLRYNAENEASGFRQKASDFTAEAAFAKSRGNQGAFSSILGGMSQEYSQYVGGVTSGLFPKLGG